MKEKIQNHSLLLIILLVACIVFIGFASLKSGMHVDEVYTLGLSNSHYAPFIRDIFPDSNMVDEVITKSDFESYLTVDQGESFDFGSVYYNQVNDVHPPLYYDLVHLVCSFFPEANYQILVLSVHFILYVLCLITLYAIALRMFHSEKLAVLGVCLYGFSAVALSTMLMIRMYSLLTLLTMTLIYLFVRLQEKPGFTLYVLVGINIFLGLMTQYYFVFYAFFICLYYVIRGLCRKEYKQTFLMSLFALSGVGIFVMVFPACIDHLFAEKLVSGGNALDNLLHITAYPKRIFYYFRRTVVTILVPFVFSLIMGVFLICSRKKVADAVHNKKVKFDNFLIVIPAFVTFLAISIMAPVLAVRYVYNICPVFILAVLFMCDLYKQSVGTIRHGISVTAGITILSLCMFMVVPPEYLYLEHDQYNKITDQHKSSPCVYFTDNYNCTITQDMLQLMQYDSVLVCNSNSYNSIKEYVDSNPTAQEYVIYVDTDEYWSSGYNSEEMLKKMSEISGFTKTEKLYKHAFSETFLLSK